MSTPSKSGSPPFVTRRSTLGFSIAALIGLGVFALLLQYDSANSSGLDLPTSLALAVFTIASFVAWVNGIVLAQRARSPFWMFVAVASVVVMPLGAIACALWAPQPPASAGGATK